MRNLVYLFVILLLLGCSSAINDTDDAKIFRYNESSGISSLDPAFARDQAMIWVSNQLFNGLLQLDDSLNILPCIAREWKVSEDGRVYTFYLRNDVYFHDHEAFVNGKGRKVTANDFVYSFKRIMDPAIASPGSWVFSFVDIEKESPFVAINDTVLQLFLKESFPPFAGILCMQYCSVVPFEVIEAEGLDFRKRPVGTGPFLFKYWKEGVKLVLLKNPNYFEKDSSGHRYPYLDAVNVSFIIDKQSAFLEFVKGNLDFISGLDPSYKDEVMSRSGNLNPKYQDKFRMIRGSYLNMEYLGINVESSIEEGVFNPLTNIKIRQAINYGFDRSKMLRYMRNNVGTPGIFGIIPPGLHGFQPDTIYSYNPVLAARLLAEAGYPAGKGLPEIKLTTTPGYLDLCIYIQHQLNELGIKLKIETSPPASLREMVAHSKIPFFRASWIADYPDAENYLSLFYSPNFCPAGPNYTHFSDPEFDRLYKLANAETNDSIRYTLYRKLDKRVMAGAPLIILYYDQVSRFVSNHVQGLGSNPLNLLTLKKVRK